MAYLTRNIDAELLRWKESPRRKPLLVRGARQVGKPWAIRHLGIRRAIGILPLYAVWCLPNLQLPE